MKILGTGLSGLVGSRIVELLSDEYEFENLSRSSGVDIIDKEGINQAINKSSASLVIHFAAKTDVDRCENDKALGENGDAWKINVLGTKNISEACQNLKKKLIYISTDFVFDGKKDSGYTEEDSPNPQNWYGQTKYEGEKIVQNLSIPWVIIRLSYPYRSQFSKIDFFRAMLGRLKRGEKLSVVEDHIFTPTFIDDVAFAIKNLIKKDALGIYHVAGSQFLTPFEGAILIAKAFDLNQSLISKTTREEFFKNRAARPLYLGIKNDKIEKLGVKMKTFKEGLKEIKTQLNI